MLDDRMITESSRDNNAPVWDSVSNKIAWKMYLGKLYGTDKIPKYAAPARETDYSGLPPAYTFVGTIEAFHDETAAYFNMLGNAGVPVKINEYKGCYHGFDKFGKRTKPGKEAMDNFLGEFIFAVNNYFAKQR